MNSIEREQIVALRAAGQSYARIAGALGLSVNSVKSFCRRNALNSGVGKPVAQIESETTQNAVSCEQCGCPVRQTPGRKHKRFCSDACRTAWWNARPLRCAVFKIWRDKTQLLQPVVRVRRAEKGVCP